MISQQGLLERIYRVLPVYRSQIRATQNFDGTFPYGSETIEHQKSVDQTAYFTAYMAHEPTMREPVLRAVRFLQSDIGFRNEFLERADIKTPALVSYALAQTVGSADPYTRRSLRVAEILFDDRWETVDRKITFPAGEVPPNIPLIHIPAGGALRLGIPEWRMQNNFMGTLGLLQAEHACGRTDTPIVDKARDFILRFQRRDGSFYYDFNSAKPDPKHALYRWTEAYRTELTVNAMNVFLETEIEPGDEVLENAYTFLGKAGPRAAKRHPGMALGMATAMLTMDQRGDYIAFHRNGSFESLPEGVRAGVKAVVSQEPPRHIAERLHTAGGLMALGKVIEPRIKKRGALN